MQSPVRTLLASVGALLLTLLLLEGGVATLVALHRLPLRRPTYSLENLKTRFWADLDPAFGVWHPPGARYRHRTSCYDVLYEANRHGARDRDRSERSAGPRVVVLGDSFVEGYGVARADRFTDRLEERTGIPHLNFGTAGSFGTTQSMLLYETLASRFDHDAVVFGILPDNDFLDDDLGHGRRRHAHRYRPYLSGDHPSYEVVYFREELGDPRTTRPLRLGKLLREFTYSANAVRHLKGVLRERAAREGSGPAERYAGYADYGDEQFARVRFALERIVEHAAGRPVLVFTIPRPADFERVPHAGTSRLAEDMQRAAREVGFQYVDLLRLLRNVEGGTDRLFLSCDGHWSPWGHEVAAGILESSFGFYAASRAAQAAARPDAIRE